MFTVKLEGVNQQKREVYVSGLDCVDGTPVLDIKPYLPCAFLGAILFCVSWHDLLRACCLYEADSDSFPGATVPMWVESNPPAAVTFASDAIQQFKTAFETGVMKFYTDFDSALIAAGEVHRDLVPPNSCALVRMCCFQTAAGCVREHQSKRVWYEHVATSPCVECMFLLVHVVLLQACPDKCCLTAYG